MIYIYLCIPKVNYGYILLIDYSQEMKENAMKPCMNIIAVLVLK